MGVKGDKMTKESASSAEWLVEKLSPIEGITVKKMFGGHGLFHESTMFGIVDSKGQCFVKVNEALKSTLVKAGASQHSKMPYYSIPESILEDQKELVDLVNKIIAHTK